MSRRSITIAAWDYDRLVRVGQIALQHGVEQLAHGVAPAIIHRGDDLAAEVQLDGNAVEYFAVVTRPRHGRPANYRPPP